MQDLSASLFQNEVWPADEELTEENWLKNAIAISLFSDQRIGEVSSHESSHRGYWADSFDPKDHPLGSRLWTLGSQAVGEEQLEDAIQFGYESLSWLLDEYVSDLNVEGELLRGQIRLSIEISLSYKKYKLLVDPVKGTHVFI